MQRERESEYEKTESPEIFSMNLKIEKKKSCNNASYTNTSNRGAVHSTQHSKSPVDELIMATRYVFGIHGHHMDILAHT